MKHFILLPGWLFSAVILTCPAFAQSGNDSLSNRGRASAYSHAEDYFNTTLGPQSRLYNGVSYDFYNPDITGSAYFMDAATGNQGSVFYDGYLYKNVNLYYDLNKDQLVTFLYHSNLKISLIPEKVKSFDLLGHHFVYINDDSAIRTGFYDELYGGKIQVLARRTKILQPERGMGGTITYYFTKTTTDYYIHKNGVYYPVSSQGSFMKVLKDKSKDLKSFIKQKKIRFKKDKEQSMAAIAADYDNLTN